MTKMSKDEYYMRLAVTTALRGTCDRRQVGAVLVHDDRILSGGFNGAPRGMPECIEVGHLMEHGHCVRTVHAEANAILEVGVATIRRLVKSGDSPVTIYTTTGPCMGCFNLIIQSHIQRVVYGERYMADSHDGDRMAYAIESARRMDIILEQFPLESLEG